MNLVEKIGSGIIRIVDEMKKYGLEEPVIEADDSWFGVVFQRKYIKRIDEESEVTVSETGSETVKLTRIQNEIINLMKKDSTISYDELSGQLGKSRATIHRHIRKLKELNIVKRAGSDKTGKWEVCLSNGKTEE